MNPESKIYTSETLTFYNSVLHELELPLAESQINVGFPSPADYFSDTNIDLKKVFIKHPAATYYAAGIFYNQSYYYFFILPYHNRKINN